MSWLLLFWLPLLVLNAHALFDGLGEYAVPDQRPGMKTCPLRGLKPGPRGPDSIPTDRRSRWRRTARGYGGLHESHAAWAPAAGRRTAIYSARSPRGRLAAPRADSGPLRLVGAVDLSRSYLIQPSVCLKTDPTKSTVYR